jgi:hypothetical protein
MGVVIGWKQKIVQLFGRGSEWGGERRGQLASISEIIEDYDPALKGIGRGGDLGKLPGVG